MKLTIIPALVLSGILLFLSSCEERKIYTPKPTGYFRIDLPAKEYQDFDTSYPYRFKYPEYAEIEIDKEPNAEPYWINIQFPALNATIHVSYKNNHEALPQFLKDSRTFAYKHTVKAEAIEEKSFSNPEKNVYGIYYDIKGEAASNTQFFLTDSVSRFLRGALYFNVPPNKDSLAPVREFVQEDIVVLINSFSWKE